MRNEMWDAVIIGGSAAGLSAAVMLGRARRRTLVIDAGEPRNRFAAHMHGVLGHDGTSPEDLLARGRAEVQAYGVEVAEGHVVDVTDADADPDTADAGNGPATGNGIATGLIVSLADGSQVRTRALVLASGLTDELPPIPGLAERWGRSILHCPYCHGWEVRDQRFGVIAISPLSLHQIELVRQWSDRVTAFTADLGEIDPAAAERLRARGIAVVDSPVIEVVGEGDAVSGVRTADGVLTPVDAIFTGGVPRPHDDMLAGLALERTETPMGSFLAVDPMNRTSHPLIWAAGNVVNPGATVPVSMSTGSMAGAAANAALVMQDAAAAVRATADA